MLYRLAGFAAVHGHDGTGDLDTSPVAAQLVRSVNGGEHAVSLAKIVIGKLRVGFVDQPSRLGPSCGDQAGAQRGAENEHQRSGDNGGGRSLVSSSPFRSSFEQAGPPR